MMKLGIIALMLMVWLEYSHVQADDHQNSIDKRLEKLEHMMEALIAKLDDSNIEKEGKKQKRSLERQEDTNTTENQVSAKGTEKCPPSSKGSGYLYTYGEKCYQFVLVDKTWNEARAWCYSKGAALMSLENSSKRQWVESILTNRLRNVFDKNGLWIGLHDRITENQWYWDEGPGVPDVRSTHFNWYPGEPNDLTGQDCVYMRRGYNWKWVDVGCDGAIGRYYSFACEHKMVPEKFTTTAATPQMNKTTVAVPQTTTLAPQNTTTSDETFTTTITNNSKCKCKCRCRCV